MANVICNVCISAALLAGRRGHWPRGCRGSFLRQFRCFQVRMEWQTCDSVPRAKQGLGLCNATSQVPEVARGTKSATHREEGVWQREKLRANNLCCGGDGAATCGIQMAKDSWPSMDGTNNSLNTLDIEIIAQNCYEAHWIAVRPFSAFSCRSSSSSAWQWRALVACLLYFIRCSGGNYWSRHMLECNLFADNQTTRRRVNWFYAIELLWFLFLTFRVGHLKGKFRREFSHIYR